MKVSTICATRGWIFSASPGMVHSREVSFQVQLEPRRAGIALAARSAAELVVDAARLVPLGAEDVQTAGGDDLLLLLVALGAELFQRRLVFGRGLVDGAGDGGGFVPA